jgi:hypothetical protein
MHSNTSRQLHAAGLIGSIHILTDWGKTVLSPSAPDWLSQGIAIAALIALLILTIKFLWAVIPTILWLAMGLLRGGLIIHRAMTRWLSKLGSQLRRYFVLLGRKLLRRIDRRLAESGEDSKH